jgi:hypothetical protein
MGYNYSKQVGFITVMRADRVAFKIFKNLTKIFGNIEILLGGKREVCSASR